MATPSGITGLSSRVRVARRSRAFTLVELMVAIACMSVLMGPIFYVYRSGSRTSLEGMVKAEITLEARRIIRQVHEDLKHSVVFIDYDRPAPSASSTYYFPVFIRGGNPYVPLINSDDKYSILRFPMHGKVGEGIESSGATAYRKPIQISYELKKEAPDQVVYTLTRKEGTLTTGILSKRVNFFEIRENPMAPASTSWFITLQLAETVKPTVDDSSWVKLMQVQGQAINSTQRRLLERTRGVQIADFFDVVSSEFYSQFRKSKFIPNWNTLITSP